MSKHYTALEMMQKLIAFPTVSSESNLDLINFVREYLAGHGVKSHLVFEQSGTKASLYAHIGPEIEGGVVFSGHTDVVPVKGQSWNTDPFKVVEKDGKYFGRGTCDMKGFNAIVLSLVPEMVATDLKRPIQIALSCDEEIGCLGAPFMISDMLDTLPKASVVVVGEPSMMRVVTGHKGSIGFTTIVHGFEVHSSLMHKGVSAVMVAARLIEWLRCRFEENKIGTPNAIDLMFEPPFTTLHVGTINGGSATNITARECRFSCDIRCPASQDPLDWFRQYKVFAGRVEAEMQEIIPQTSIKIIPREVIPALCPEENGVAESLIRQITGDNGTHVVSYSTEAGQFQHKDYSVVVCGPGSIEQAHQPNEYITKEQFQTGTEFIRQVITKLTGD
ncbi:MAG: acetylornithine deacetylase [Rhizobiaceae bacterium]|nr:acetylornithine deacetylase [Rhizobiaceae bacterium]